MIYIFAPFYSKRYRKQKIRLLKWVLGIDKFYIKKNEKRNISKKPTSRQQR